jgi:hypothetical protein
VRIESILDFSLDILHHDDGVVHDDAGCQNQAEQREGVDREPGAQQCRQGTDDRHGHGNQRDDARAPGLQEDDDHEHDQQHRFE